MNAETPIASAVPLIRQDGTELLFSATRELTRVRAAIDEVDGALEIIAGAGDKGAERAARKLQRQLRRIEPSATLIGQVKAGKTSLVNALVGWPDLLPSDVNPWTSVVTSLHLSPRPHLGGDHATFRFFEENEWTRLLDRGGRIGELAGRAGAEDEVAKVTEQLAAMREKSRRRLGNKFEMLMGQEHDYGYLDSELVERYVCLGDDFGNDTETSATQGRFADITKSADLYIQRDAWPIDFCIRDTPGVNDTFMMREQITIRAIRESRMCVVVLSAHQALSTVDLALIRLISNLDSREVILFVNRIDELSDPARQVPEIRDSIRRTLTEHKGPAEAEIVFGSAYWANHALTGDLDGLSAESSAALANWVEVERPDLAADMIRDETLWALSGVPALLAAIARRSETGVVREALSRAAREGMNILAGIATSDQLASRRPTEPALARNEVPQRIEAVARDSLSAFDQRFAKVLALYHSRLDRVHASFLDRATASLVTHLERNGDAEVWHYDATGLRVLLRSTFQVFAHDLSAACAAISKAAVEEIGAIYRGAFGMEDGSFRLEPPPPPHVPPPVTLGQTIALDLSAGWWSRWWRRRRGYGSYASDFAQMIAAETAPIVATLRGDQATAVVEEARAALAGFLAAQSETLTALAARPETSEPAAQGIEATARRNALDRARSVLARLAA